MVDDYYKTDPYHVRKSVGYLIRRASKQISGEIESLFSDQDVSFIQYVILMNMRDGLVSTAAEIVQVTCHDSGAITRILDQLEQRGLVGRTRSSSDRRVIELHLTEAGRKTVESLLPLVVRLYNTLLSDFTRDEADMLISLLSRFSDNLVKYSGSKG